MISVRCPACGKLMGFEESDAGSLIACPLCRQSFFIPPLAQPVASDGAPAPPGTAVSTAPAVVPPLPLEPTLPDDIRLADDPDLEPIPELCDEVLPVEEEAPPAEPEPAGAPLTAVIPHLELDPPEPVDVPPIVKPTDVAPSLSAAVSLSEAVAPEDRAPDKPVDVLEEVRDDREEREAEDEEREDEEEGRRRRSKKRGAGYRTPYHDRPRRPGEGLTRNRVLGGVGVAMGGLILLGTLAHHATASQAAWHPAVCCGDLFALTLAGAGLYYLVRG